MRYLCLVTVLCDYVSVNVFVDLPDPRVKHNAAMQGIITEVKKAIAKGGKKKATLPNPLISSFIFLNKC